MSRSESRWLVPVRDIGVRFEFDSSRSGTSELEIGLIIGDALMKLPIEIAEGKWRLKESQHFFESEVLISVFVDGRLLVGTDHEGVSVEAIREPREERLSHAPIVLRLVSGKLGIRNAHIIRDIHYRGPMAKVNWHFLG